MKSSIVGLNSLTVDRNTDTSGVSVKFTDFTLGHALDLCP
jgi:hypothetical protein